MTKKAKTDNVEIAESDFNALFEDAENVEAIQRKAKNGLFDSNILSKTVANLLENKKPLNIEAFYGIAKLGKRNDDAIHKNYYVTRAVKMEMLKQKKAIDLLDNGSFNDPASTKILQEHLNNKAFKILNAIFKDGRKAELLQIDIETAFN
jgi:uncharacterized protein YdaT